MLSQPHDHTTTNPQPEDTTMTHSTTPTPGPTLYFTATYLTEDDHLHSLEGAVQTDDGTPLTLDDIREDIRLQLHPARLLLLETPEDTTSIEFHILEKSLTAPQEVTTFQTID